MAKFTISGFTDEISGNLDEQIKTMHELGQNYFCPRGVNGINISKYSSKKFEKNVLPILNKENIHISSIGSPIGKLFIYDEISFLIQLKKLKELVKIAKMTNCQYIRMFSFYYGNANPDKVFPIVVRKIKAFLKVVKGTGVKLLHENEKLIYGDVPSRVLKLYEEINDPDFVLCFDASNYIQCDVDVKEAFDLLKDKTVYYHIKDCYKYKIEVPVGLGLGNYNYILKTLIDNNFEGFLTLEPHLMYGYVPRRQIAYKLANKESKDYLTFKHIDEAMGVKETDQVTKKDTYVWQYNNLTKLLKENGYEGSF